jgi:hypothetical protein
MLHTVEPGPFFDATWVNVCPPKLKVRSKARGWNTAVLPSVKVRCAAFQVTAAWVFPLFTTNVPDPTGPQLNVPVVELGAFTGCADALTAPNPTKAAERPATVIMPAPKPRIRWIAVFIR